MYLILTILTVAAGLNFQVDEAVAVFNQSMPKTAALRDKLAAETETLARQFLEIRNVALTNTWSHSALASALNRSLVNVTGSLNSSVLAVGDAITAVQGMHDGLRRAFFAKASREKEIIRKLAKNGSLAEDENAIAARHQVAQLVNETIQNATEVFRQTDRQFQSSLDKLESTQQLALAGFVSGLEGMKSEASSLLAILETGIKQIDDMLDGVSNTSGALARNLLLPLQQTAVRSINVLRIANASLSRPVADDELLFANAKNALTVMKNHVNDVTSRMDNELAVTFENWNTTAHRKTEQAVADVARFNALPGIIANSSAADDADFNAVLSHGEQRLFLLSKKISEEYDSATSDLQTFLDKVNSDAATILVNVSRQSNDSALNMTQEMSKVAGRLSQDYGSMLLGFHDRLRRLNVTWDDFDSTIFSKLSNGSDDLSDQISRGLQMLQFSIDGIRDIANSSSFHINELINSQRMGIANLSIPIIAAMYDVEESANKSISNHTETLINESDSQTRKSLQRVAADGTESLAQTDKSMSSLAVLKERVKTLINTNSDTTDSLDRASSDVASLQSEPTARSTGGIRDVTSILGSSAEEYRDFTDNAKQDVESRLIETSESASARAVAAAVGAGRGNISLLSDQVESANKAMSLFEPELLAAMQINYTRLVGDNAAQALGYAAGLGDSARAVVADRNPAAAALDEKMINSASSSFTAHMDGNASSSRKLLNSLSSEILPSLTRLDDLSNAMQLANTAVNWTAMHQVMVPNKTAFDFLTNAVDAAAAAITRELAQMRFKLRIANETAITKLDSTLNLVDSFKRRAKTGVTAVMREPLTRKVAALKHSFSLMETIHDRREKHRRLIRSLKQLSGT